MNRSAPFSLSLLAALFVSLVLFQTLSGTGYAAAETMVVSAEGLADPEAEMFKRDKAILHDALLDDAKKQAVEKVVGMYVDSRSLVENYSLVQDNVLTQTRGLIKQVLSTSEPWLADDGFMHMTIKAEVYSAKTQDSLKEMSRGQRLELIKKSGNPRISVAVTVRDAERGSQVGEQRSGIAENLVKDHIKEFGYRVWSSKDEAQVDFQIKGEVKFKPIHMVLATSGVEINKVAITSWTISCLETVTGEEVYFNNKIPSQRSWNTEDEALAAIGELIGQEFSKDFFENQLLSRTKTYQVEIRGIANYDYVNLFKNELTGLRPVLNVELRSFDNAGSAFFEVEFSGNELDFSEFLNSGILKPLNAKFGKNALTLASVKNLAIRLQFRPQERGEKVLAGFRETPPSSLAAAAPERIHQVATTDKALERVKAVNPKAVASVAAYRKSGGSIRIQSVP